MSDADFDRHLANIAAAGERTRGILYFLGLVFCSTLIINFETRWFDWPKARFDRMHEAYTCYVQALDTAQCLKAYKYVSDYYKIELFDPQSEKINSKHDQVVAERYRQTIRSYVDNTSATVPLVGARYDKNSATIFHNTLIFFIVCVLLLSLQNEARCLDTIVRMNQVDGQNHLDQQKRALILNSHIFAGPQTSNFWHFLFVPPIISTVQIVSDIVSFPISLDFTFYMDMLGSTGLIVPAFEIITTALLFLACWACFLAAKTFDQKLTELRDGSP